MAPQGASGERYRMTKKKPTCLACGQPLDGTVVRGCHERCYKATMRAVARGETTEAERIKAGKLLASETGGRPPSNPVSKELRTKR